MTYTLTRHRHSTPFLSSHEFSLTRFRAEQLTRGVYMPLRATAFAGLCLGLKLFGLRVAETGCFGLLLGSGRCLSPREASLDAVSLLLPAADTFDAATFVLAGEVFLVVFLGAVEMGLVEAVAEVPAQWLAAQHFWLLAQAAQVAASALFLRGQLGATAGAVGATALAHASLGSRLVALEPLSQVHLRRRTGRPDSLIWVVYHSSSFGCRCCWEGPCGCTRAGPA